MTIEEVVDTFSEGLPEWQKVINCWWLSSVWGSLKIGGHWAHPDTGKVWVKTPEGFEEVKSYE
jgi:hypothetical protein